MTSAERTNLFIPSRFWTTYTNFDTCCQRYIATCGKYFIWVHRRISQFTRVFVFWIQFTRAGDEMRTVYRALERAIPSEKKTNYCSGSFFFKSLSEVVRTNFSADFWTFHNFCTHFGDSGAIWRRNENYIALLKGRSLLKKNCWKLRQNWSINRDVMIGRTMHPVERRAHAIGAWQKKYTNTTFSHLQPARVIRSSPNFAWR